jgi:hypothetical protein
VYHVIVFLSVILPMLWLSSKLKINLIIAKNLTSRSQLNVGFPIWVSKVNYEFMCGFIVMWLSLSMSGNGCTII